MGDSHDVGVGTSPPTSPIQTPVPPPARAPTIFVAYGQRTVKARVEHGVPLGEIMRQLVASTQLGLGSEPPALFALRSEGGELVTEDNIGRFLQQEKPRFVLTSSPTLEAAELVEKLLSTDVAVQKLATFSLRTLIREDGFLTEFEQRGGLQALQEVIRKASGNTLAYALLSLQNFLQDDRGWQGLDRDFAGRIVEIIAKEPLINVSRPATAILRKLSQTPLAASTEPSSSSDIKSLPVSGFATIYAEIAEQPDFLKIVLGRLSSGDVAVATLSLDLINSLFRGATEMGDNRLGEDLEKLNAWKLVRKLLESQIAGGGDLASLLAFQDNVISFLHLELSTPVTESLYGLFDDVWFTSGIEEGDETMRWRRLGYQTESPQYEYQQTGALGLKALASFAQSYSAEFSTALKEQLLRPEDRRCPIATVSSAVLLILAEYFDAIHGKTQSPTLPQPSLLRFYECHSLVTLFFIRMWQESGATVGDFDRVATLTRSQVEFTLSPSTERSWYEIKQDFVYAEYRAVRDRQMREMELEDDILSKAPVRNLRGRLYQESYEFIRSQRISCLMEGAWFRVTISTVPHASQGKKSSYSTPNRKWRFYRLAANRRMLHYCETAQRVPIRGGLEDLQHKIDLSSVTEVIGGASANAAQRRSRAASQTSSSKSPTFGSTKQNNGPAISSNPLAIALVSNEGIIAEMMAPNQETYSEWVDGLSLLRPDGSITTKETADFVQILTDINAKIKLLDLSGERVEIPSSLAVSQVPRSTDFFYADSI